MMMLILSFLKKIITNPKCIVVLIIIILGTLLFFSIRKNNILEKDNDRLEFNLENINFDIDSVRTKNGDLQYSVNQLVIKNNELGKISEEFADDLKDMKLKYKNLESSTKIEIRYETIHDTLYTEAINPDVNGKSIKFHFNISDEFNSTSGNINTSEPVKKAFIDSMIIDVKDGITTAFETKYKGWWFWRKPVSTTLHIKSDNPKMKLNKVETYKFIKK